MDTQVLADAQPEQQSWRCQLCHNAVDAEGITELADMIITHGLMLKRRLVACQEKIRIIIGDAVDYRDPISLGRLVDAGFTAARLRLCANVKRILKWVTIISPCSTDQKRRIRLFWEAE